MNPSVLRSCAVSLIVLAALLLFSFSPGNAADGRKWDGKKYPFRLLDPSKTNSESNPFIIDTAGKLAYFSWLSAQKFDFVEYGRTNGINGLNYDLTRIYLKLTADLDMNGSKFEFTPIALRDTHFDGGGHVIANLRISNTLTRPTYDDVARVASIELALFQSATTIKNLGIGKGSTITYHGTTAKELLVVNAAAIAVEADEIDNCFSDASISVKGNGDAVVAGVVTSCGRITNSYNRGSIAFEGNILDARAHNVQKIARPGKLKVAGVCVISQTAFSGCYNTGAITVKASGEDVQIGGVAIETNKSDYTNLYNTGTLRFLATGDIKNAYIGGVLGSGFTYRQIYTRPIRYIDSGYIYNKGSIDVTVQTGRLVSVGGITGGDKKGFGDSVDFGGVYGCINTYNTGSISVRSTGKVDTLNAGGIAGNGCMVINSYNAGSISGTSTAGTTLNLGGIGGKDVYVQNSYSIGAVSGKGTGTNFVGGIIGHTGIRWADTDGKGYSVMNGFWLKQPKTGGINSDVRYGKGSYYYKKDDTRESALNSILGALSDNKTISRKDPNKMIEDSYGGTVYSFDSPTTSVMARTDDDPGKRANVKGTLLDNLNEMVADKSERLYRKWTIDKTNSGYPVLSSIASTFTLNAEKIDQSVAKLIAGEYKAEHKQWNDKVFINDDGTFRRATGGDSGTWSYDGKRLILKWKKWAPETLVQKAPGSFSSTSYKFMLKR